MTPRLLNLGLSAHRQVQDLLPWYVMGTLDEQDRALVKEHVATCLICQRDVEWHRELRSACDEAVPQFDVERTLAQVRTRVAAARSEPRPAHKSWTPWPSWTRWAIAAQVAVVVGFAALTKLPDNASPAIYRALGRATANDASARLLVVFAPQITEEELRTILHASGARIVDGPTSTDAYVLDVPPQRAHAALLALRAERSVILVESLGADAPR